MKKVIMYTFRTALTSYSTAVTRKNGDIISVTFEGYISRIKPFSTYTTTDEEICELLKKHPSHGRFFQFMQSVEAEGIISNASNYEVLSKGEPKEVVEAKEEPGSKPEEKDNVNSEDSGDKVPDEPVVVKEPGTQDVPEEKPSAENTDIQVVDSITKIGDAKAWLAKEKEVKWDNMKNGAQVLVEAAKVNVSFPEIEKLVNKTK